MWHCFSEKANLTGVNVLLAEDNELNAEIAAVQLEEFGMNAHLSKPIVIDEVIKTILRYVHFDKE